jgi:hypothetical protein
MKIFFPFLLGVLCFGAKAQKFPDGFIGNWEGELVWYQPGKKEPQKVATQLRIQPADTPNHFTWQIIYGKETEDNRAYVLKPVDTARGHWVIDERNGIILDQYWLGGKFCSAFTVGGTSITDCYWVEGEKMMIEFLAFSSQPINTTGGNEKEIPAVNSYGIKNYQKAVLTPKNK